MRRRPSVDVVSTMIRRQLNVNATPTLKQRQFNTCMTPIGTMLVLRLWYVNVDVSVDMTPTQRR